MIELFTKNNNRTQHKSYNIMIISW
jgi:hypothetical protein